MELKIQELSKSYGSQVAIQNVNLDLKPGTIALLGPNGSGKTTLLRCLASLMKPDDGQLWFDGFPYTKNLPRLRGQLGYLPQDLDLPSSLTPRRLLEYLGMLKNIPEDGQVANAVRSRISKAASLACDVDRLLSALGLEKIADVPFGKLSGGQIRLVGIAQAFLDHPGLLLLDELTQGLDVEERERVFALARRPAPGRLILYSTHDPTDAERFADRVIILHQGQVIFWGEIDDLYRQAQDALHQVIVPDGEAIPGNITASQEVNNDEKTTLWGAGQPLSGRQDSPGNSTFEQAYLWLLSGCQRVENY